ncbi:hypothetical protein FDZ71_10060 [bacterium]|nr:MAG: hypothetical protein FDZ71_10060 [bacterium]
MPPEYLAALKAFAFQSGVPLAEYVRGMVHDHILQSGAAFRERGAALRALINAGKAWIIAHRECVAVAGGLPGKERRAELERPTWDAVKKAHEFIQSEEAAKNAKHRMLAIQAVALITRAEAEILADMDKAEVDQIVERIEAALNVMDKIAESAPAKGARGK